MKLNSRPKSVPLRECQALAIKCVTTRRVTGEPETNLSLCTGAGKSRIIREITGKAERRILVFPWLDLLKQFFNEHKTAYTTKCIRYLATEDTLTDIPRMSDTMAELDEPSYVIFTTYTSAPLIYANIGEGRTIDLICHDEAHRAERAEYKAALIPIISHIKHIVNLSATLPTSKQSHYKYSLLRGIDDGVVRDFHMELFLCVEKERAGIELIYTMINKLKQLHSNKVKLLIYTAEANTDADNYSSVKTFMDAHATALKEKGWWIEGIKADTKDRQALLREFEKPREVSILVSCKTLSEGIDLQGANCMLPWDPSCSVVDNIQRIGRVLRLYKDREEQLPSTVLIPVFLNEAKYQACEGNREAIDALLCSEISEGERGNFRPIVNVCTALKNELADDDEELFNRLLNYPYEPTVAVNRDLVDCVARQLKKPAEVILGEVADYLALTGGIYDEQLEEVRGGEWSEEIDGLVAEAVAKTQDITLIVRDGDDVDMFGNGERDVVIEKNEDGGYKAVREGRGAADKAAAQKRVAQRMKYEFSDECKILLGLETVEGADKVGGMMLTRLTTEVQFDENWEERRLEWVDMYEKLGRFPSQKAKDKEERRAAIWQSNMRKGYHNKCSWMTESRIQKLSDETKGWIWEESDLWYEKYNIWKEFVSINKRLPILSDIGNGKIAYDFQSWERRKKRGYQGLSIPNDKLKILNEDPNWKWEDDRWDKQYENWKTQWELKGGKPSKKSKNKEERDAGNWQCAMRSEWTKKQNDPTYNSKKLTPERFEILDKNPNWEWDDQKWEKKLEEWITQTKLLGRCPSNNSKDPAEKSAASWQTNQRTAKNQNKPHMTPERIKILDETPGWTWSAKEEPKVPLQAAISVPTQPSEPEQLKPRKRLVIKPKVTPTETPEQVRHRQRSKLEKYHQRFKTMNAATYKSAITEAEFTAYHKVADTYDARDPPERQPLNKIAEKMKRWNKMQYNAIDLGCGTNRLRTNPAVSSMRWTSVDVVSIDDTVTVADMAALPYDDETYDFAVMCRSLWARNHTDVLKELHRILKSGGRAIICESFNRWMASNGGAGDQPRVNTLLGELRDVGFVIDEEEGTSQEDHTDDVFQYITVRKP